MQGLQSLDYIPPPDPQLHRSTTARRYAVEVALGQTQQRICKGFCITTGGTILSQQAGVSGRICNSVALQARSEVSKLWTSSQAFRLIFGLAAAGAACGTAVHAAEERLNPGAWHSPYSCFAAGHCKMVLRNLCLHSGLNI